MPQIEWEMLLHADYTDVSSMLYQMYWEENQILEEIADKLGVGKATLLKKFEDLNIPRRPKGGGPDWPRNPKKKQHIVRH